MNATKQRGITFVIIFFVLAAILTVALVFLVNREDDETPIANFAECVAAGYPVMESFPEQCSDGQNTFVNDAVSVPDIDQTLQ